MGKKMTKIIIIIYLFSLLLYSPRRFFFASNLSQITPDKLFTTYATFQCENCNNIKFEHIPTLKLALNQYLIIFIILKPRSQLTDERPVRLFTTIFSKIFY